MNQPIEFVQLISTAQVHYSPAFSDLLGDNERKKEKVKL